MRYFFAALAAAVCLPAGIAAEWALHKPAHVQVVKKVPTVAKVKPTWSAAKVASMFPVEPVVQQANIGGIQSWCLTWATQQWLDTLCFPKRNGRAA